MKINGSQKHILDSGGWWGMYDGLTAGYLIAYALALGASNTIVGVIGAIPFIAALLSEIPGAKLLERFSRLKIYRVSSTLARLGWIGIIVAPFVFTKAPLFAVVMFFFLIRCLDYLADPAWTTLLADVIPPKIRGEFIARRIKLIGIAGMISLIVGGWYLDLFISGDLFGFVTMFGIGVLCGLATTFVTTRVKEPPYQDHIHHGFREFFKIEGDFKKYTLFVFCFNFAFMLASPFFTAYILHDLGQSYTIFALSTAVATISKILVFTHMGKLSDKYGDKPVLLLSVMSTALVPFAFIFVTVDTLWLLWPAQILAGIAWAGYDVSIFNMFLSLTTPDKRAVQTATYNIVTSIPLVIAPIVGGWIADNIAIGLVGIPVIFLLSGGLRFLTSLLLIRIPENRVKHNYALSEVFLHTIEMHPSRGLQTRWVGLMRNVKRRGLLFTGLFR